ncbi:hypothetical protein C8Q74DRAFT_388648 [Fomes fomentarius]|nr:hypothetical protein C8Q74DRAFT_388648 [Fomes fomentarius]
MMSYYPAKSQSACDALGLQFGTDKPHTRTRSSPSSSGMETSTNYGTLPLPISSVFDPEDSSQPEQASLPPLILIQAPTSPGPEQAKPQSFPWPAAGPGSVLAPIASLSPLQTLVSTPAPVRAPPSAPGLAPSTTAAYSLRPAIFSPRASRPPCWPQTIPIPLHAKVDCHYFLRVASNGSRGVCLAHLDTTFNGAEPRVGLASIREKMDWADTCLCSHTMGPTVRMADVGKEWAGSFRYMERCPIPKTDEACFTFGRLAQFVIDHFLAWWACEKAARAEEEDEYDPDWLGPGTVPLDKVYIVALRRRHLAFGVFEWMPEIEIRL